MTEKCFKKCVLKPGTSLDSSEQVNNITLTSLSTFGSIIPNRSIDHFFFFFFFLRDEFQLIISKITSAAINYTLRNEESFRICFVNIVDRNSVKEYCLNFFFPTAFSTTKKRTTMFSNQILNYDVSRRYTTLCYYSLTIDEGKT